MLVFKLILLFTVAVVQADQETIGFFSGDICGRTRNGCYCKDQWGWSGQLYSGCQRPDNDPNGSWCIIDQNCQFDRDDPTYMVKDKQGNHTGDYWQYCNGYYCPLGSGVEEKEKCFATIAGCQCKQSWNYVGGDGLTYEGYEGCANPDNDDTGPWCVVDPNTCVNPPPGNTESLYPKQTDEMWDHCQCKSKAVAIGAKTSIAKTSLGKIDSDASQQQGPPLVIVAPPQQQQQQESSVEDCDPGKIPRCF